MKKTKDQIEKELKVLLLKIIDIEPKDLKPNAHFFKDLGVDSIKAIEIAVSIEKTFKVTIAEEEIQGVTTLSKATEIIHRSLEKK